MDVNRLCPGCMREMDGDVCPHCGCNKNEPQDNNHALRPYTILNGKYLVGNVLGEGGFGITYVGFDLNLEIALAIKEFYPSGFVTRESNNTSRVTEFSGSNAQADYSKWKESFVMEARNLAKFTNMAGIVNVRDFFQENNTAYIIMEYVRGESLKAHLKSLSAPMGVDETLKLLEPVVKSLSKIHAAGIVHRDISPDNLMIEKGGGVKLIDFGAARDFSDGDEKSRSVLLKPGYAPEEQYRTRGELGPWTDVYALSATIYRCITGTKPVEAMERMRTDELKKPSELGIAIAPDIEAAVMKGMAVFAENRVRTMGELYDLLYSGGEGVSQTGFAAGMGVPGAVPSGSPSPSGAPAASGAPGGVAGVVTGRTGFGPGTAPASGGVVNSAGAGANSGNTVTGAQAAGMAPVGVQLGKTSTGGPQAAGMAPVGGPQAAGIAPGGFGQTQSGYQVPPGNAYPAGRGFASLSKTTQKQVILLICIWILIIAVLTGLVIWLS